MQQQQIKYLAFLEVRCILQQLQFFQGPDFQCSSSHSAIMHWVGRSKVALLLSSVGQWRKVDCKGRPESPIGNDLEMLLQ